MSSDDPSDSGRDNPDDLPPTSEGQGRWLGTVRSWIGGGAGSGSGDQGDDNSDAVPDSAPSPALNAEEIRRRRLQKMEASMSQKKPQGKQEAKGTGAAQGAAKVSRTPSTAGAATGSTSSSTSLPQRLQSSPLAASASPSEPAPGAPTAKADLATKAESSDVRVATASIVKPPSMSVANGAESIAAVPGLSTGAKGPGRIGAQQSSVGKSVTPEQRMHDALRAVLQVALTLEESTQSGWVYVGEAVAGMLLSEDNIPEAVCARLAAPNKNERGVGYLMRAYARCQGELQSLRRKAGKADVALALKALESMRTQLVSFSATCLTEATLPGKWSQELLDSLSKFPPGIFDEPEADSREQLLSMLSSETQAETIPTGFLPLVMAELEVQGGLEDVVGWFVDKLSGKMKESRTASDPWVGPCNGLSALLQASKKACEVVAKQTTFALPRPGTPAAAPYRAPVPTGPAAFQLMMQGLQPNAMTDPRWGPMAANNTILGRLFRLGYPVDDPFVRETFSNIFRRTRHDVVSRLQTVQARLRLVQSTSSGVVMRLVTASPESRKAVVAWFADALLVNTSAEAFNPDRLKVATPEFLGNVSVALLNLAMPIVRDESKFAKIDAPSLLSSRAAVHALLPEDTTMLITNEEQEEPQGGSSGRDVAIEELKSFTTQAFFICWRGLHLGLIQIMGRHEGLHQRLGRLQNMMDSDPLAEQQFNALFVMKMAAEVLIKDEGILTDSLLFMVRAGTWLTEFVAKEAGVPIDSSEHKEGSQAIKGLSKDSPVWRLPEHFVDDILQLVIYLTKLNPTTLGTTHLYPLMTMVVFFLAHPSLVRSPHLRAALGDVLYLAFLPRSERSAEEFPPGLPLGNDPHTELLYTHPLAQEYLAPSLLLLYGDVEHTGFYQKLHHRFYIAAVLKYLWRSQEHRSTFRRISQDTNKFVRFANGLMNESNSLVASVMEKLPEIRTTQLQMRDAAQWGALSESQRNQITDRLSENEHELKSNLTLCNETLHMVAYLTSDPDIQKPFLRDELLPRLAEMLLCVLKQLVGAKGLEIKVDNPERYNFRPKDMLREICTTISQFSKQPGFHKAMATSGYYQEDLLPKALATMRRLQLLPVSALADMEALCGAVAEARVAYDAAEASIGEVPDEFLDPVLCHVMRDPVRLPTSGTVMDRSTIVQHLLNDNTDPFNRQPLTEDMLEPQTDLRQRVEEFLSRRSGSSGGAAAGAAAAAGAEAVAGATDVIMDDAPNPGH